METKTLPNEAPNPMQIAPGPEAGEETFSAPYTGWRPSPHVGYPLNGTFGEGSAHGRE